MSKQELENLSDREIETLVEKLLCDVKQKRCQVESINKELGEIQQSILKQQGDRQKFAKNLFQAEEAAPLIEESRKLQRRLREKQNQLSKLSKGEANEQSEVRELESRLDELQSRTEIESLEEENKENTEVIQSLEATYKERQAACERAREELHKLQEEVDHLKSLQWKQTSAAVVPTGHCKTKHNEELTLSKKLDKLILKSSREAGLKL